jgi:hypothetical protein
MSANSNAVHGPRPIVALFTNQNNMRGMQMSKLSRRSFFKAAGVTAAAVAGKRHLHLLQA